MLCVVPPSATGVESCYLIMSSALLRFLGPTPLSRRKALWGIALVAPNTLGLFFFFGIPVLMAFSTSLQEWNAIKPATFIGLDNFTRLADDPTFWNALENTFKLLLMTVPAEIALALGVAILLNQPLAGRSFFRAAYFLPVVTSTVAASVVWTWIFQPRYGIINSTLSLFGVGEIKWLTEPSLALIPVAVVAIWQRVGFDMVLFLAGLQSIPGVLYEAALIDGASTWQRFRHVTLPMLSPTTFLVTVLAVVNAFQIFDQVYIMTLRTVPGGVGGSATTLTYFLYRRAFTNSEFGYASAVALVLFVIILAVTIIQLRTQRYWVYYESEEG
ncbi:carbohydrate ABC transporter permease [Aggregatilinea lenta]|uniref:carbohydrate ABC transporter permease n=1 Tax=Aggregatilinea lenta TaxID=913108 RepID=UPI001EE7B761|nr:sugar ABC transporter permease [Aggregatilinea lenta]